MDVQEGYNGARITRGPLRRAQLEYAGHVVLRYEALGDYSLQAPSPGRY